MRLNRHQIEHLAFTIVRHLNKDGKVILEDKNKVLDEIVALLQGYAADYPDICQVHNIGPSSTDKDIWALKITDNPELEEDEPEFKYISTVHGDEVTGVVIA